jgi:ubiquinol-cytochrome c reductase cytochrome b subunit
MCIALGYLGSQAPDGWYLFFGRLFTLYYFAFFLVVMPLIGWYERPGRLPGSITESVLGPQHATSAPTHTVPKRKREAVA